MNKSLIQLLAAALVAALVSTAALLVFRPESRNASLDAGLQTELKALNERLAEVESRIDSEDRALALISQQPTPGRGELAGNEPNATWTAKRLLQTYLSAPTWTERLPLVVDPERLRPIMERYYVNYRPPESFHINLQEDPEHPVGETWTVSVSMGNEISHYVISQTDSGPRLDWLASKKAWEEDAERMAKQRENRIREQWGLKNATIEARVLRVVQSYSYTNLFVEITNRSEAHVSFVGLKATVYDRNGTFLAHKTTNESDIPSGEKTIVEFSFREVSAPRVASWQLVLDGVVVARKSGEKFDAAQYFTFREKDKK